MSGAVQTACCQGESWCAVTCTAEMIGKKWHPVIVHQLLETEGLGFNRLKERIDGISGKVLSESLQDLEARGLVDREVVSDRPLRVSYSLTSRGRDLAPVVEAMADWGKKHLAPA